MSLVSGPTVQNQANQVDPQTERAATPPLTFMHPGRRVSFTTSDNTEVDLHPATSKLPLTPKLKPSAK